MPEGKEFTFVVPAAMGISDIRGLIDIGEKHLAQETGPFLIDCGSATFINSMTLGAILKLHNVYRRRNRSVILLNITDSIADTLKTSGLVHILNIQHRKEARIDLTGATVSLAVELDFELFQDIGIFKFGGSMLTPSDTELFFNMAKKILVDGHKMLIDMSDLVYIDSMGIGAIIKIHQIMKSHKGEIRICSAGDILRDVFERQSLTSIIRLYDTREQALSGWVQPV